MRGRTGGDEDGDGMRLEMAACVVWSELIDCACRGVQLGTKVNGEVQE